MNGSAHRIALVIMPWVDVELPPLGVAVLKAYLQQRGFAVDCLYLNIKMAEKIGGMASQLSRLSDAWNEWFFSYHLFGPGGTGEIPFEWSHICVQPGMESLLKELEINKPTAETLLKDAIPSFIEDCLKTIAWERYRLIGFSSVFSSHAACLKLSKEIKIRFPHIPIVFGGSNVEGEMGRATLAGCEWIDFVVDGEAEKSLAALLKSLVSGTSWESIPGVCGRKDGNIIAGNRIKAVPMDLNLLPTPNHDDFFKQLRATRLRHSIVPYISFEGSRGCWWGQKQHCTFCGLNGNALPFRQKRAELVLRDILALHRRYKSMNLWACDNILGMEHLRRLVPMMQEVRENLHLDWNVFFEVKSNLNAIQLRQLARAGVLNLQPGIESLSTPILRLMRKGVRAIQNVQFLKNAAESGITAVWNLLGGFPGESPAEYTKMADLILSLLHLNPPEYCGLIRIDRFSPYHFDFKKFGMPRPNPMPAYQYVYPRARFQLDRIAYSFGMNRPRGSPEPAAYMRPVTEAVDFWRKNRSKAVFYFRQGFDFVLIADSRPTSISGGFCYREDTLEGLEAAVFSYCTTLRSFGQIAEFCRDREYACSSARLREILEKMRGRRWLMQEDDFYLNLATMSEDKNSRNNSAVEVETLKNIYIPLPFG
ncbi:MAG: RiPP maturation radical SAM C-methyltransferase [Elusimicrobiota bacterium]